MRKIKGSLLAIIMSAALAAGTIGVPVQAAATQDISRQCTSVQKVKVQEVPVQDSDVAYQETSGQEEVLQDSGVSLQGRSGQNFGFTLNSTGFSPIGSSEEDALQPSGSQVIKVYGDSEVISGAVFPYTGKAVCPVFTVTDGDDTGRVLTYKRDYTYSYKNNKNAGAASSVNAPSVIYKFKGNYSGTVTLKFTISALSIDPDSGLSCVPDMGLTDNGKPQKVVPAVYYNGKKLKPGTDYKVTKAVNESGKSSGVTKGPDGKYVTLTKKGVFTVTLEGSGNYGGTAVMKVTVGDKSSKDLGKAKASFLAPKKVIIKEGTDGKPDFAGSVPGVSVSFGGEDLTENKDYVKKWTVTDGGAVVVISPYPGTAYIGTKVLTCKTTGSKTLKTAIVSGAGDQFYTGYEVGFTALAIKDGNAVLTEYTPEGTDASGPSSTKDRASAQYYVTYSKNVYTGTAKAVVTGINAYAGSSLNLSFRIKAPDKLALSVNGFSENAEAPFEKGGTTGDVTVTCEQGDRIRLLYEGTDYSLKFENNKTVGSKAVVSAKGKGIYAGATGTLDYKVVQQTDPEAVVVDIADVQFKPGITGADAKKTKVTVTDLKGTKLVEGTDYKLDGVFKDEAMTTPVSDGENLKAGDVLFAKYVMDNENYKLQKAAAFRVYEKENAVSSAKVAFEDNGNEVYSAEKKGYYYTGSKITPGWGLFSGTVLIDGSKDKITLSRNSLENGYFIDPASFRKNVNKGTGSFMLYGTGSLGGSKKVSFKIVDKPASKIGVEENESLEVIRASGATETAFIEWKPYGGGVPVDGYNVYCKKSSANEWKKIDDMLIRGYADAPGGTTVSYWRADVPGLSAGSYDLRVAALVSGSETDVKTDVTGLAVTAHDRSGYAFAGNQTPGAYKADGTLKDGAYVLYVTEENKDDVYVYVTNASGEKEKKTGLQNIFDAYSKGNESHPLDVRLIGCITRLKSAAKAEIVVKNNKEKGTGITLEGIGEDAVVNGASVAFGNASYCEIRNIAVMNSNSEEKDDITISGSQYVWVHNCDLFYGEPGKDSDQAKGDGAMDCVVSNYATFSYNHFWDTGKSILLGLSENNKSYGDNPLFVTYHHNWFDHSDSRHPRTRFYNAHVYNNYFDGNAKYGIGATMASSIFSEGNYFRSTTKPMLISMQGTDVCKGYESPGSSGTFSDEDGGMIKSYNNKMEGNNTYLSYDSKNYLVNGEEKAISTLDTQKHFDAVEVRKRSDILPETLTSLKGGNYYSNFDTAEGFYSYSADDPDKAKEKVLSLAGRLNHGDFTWEFDNSVDDASSELNQPLKDKLEAYRTSLVTVPADADYEGVTESKDSSTDDWVEDRVTITAEALGITAESLIGTEAYVNYLKAEVNADGSVTLISRDSFANKITIAVKGKEAGKTRAYIVVNGIVNGVGGLGTPEVTKARDFDPAGNTVTVTTDKLGLVAASYEVSPASLKGYLTVTVSAEGAVSITPLAECDETITVTVKDDSSNTAVILISKIADTGAITYDVDPFRGKSILFFNSANKTASMAAATDTSDVTVGNATGVFYYSGSAHNSRTPVFQPITKDNQTVNGIKWKSDSISYTYSGDEDVFVVSFTITPKKAMKITDASAGYAVNKNKGFKVKLSVGDSVVTCNDSGNYIYSFSDVPVGISLEKDKTYDVKLSLKAKGFNLDGNNMEVYIGDLVLGYELVD